jgi:co-chaperonin GroES (HSP10)
MVLIKREEVQELTDGGILLPEDIREREEKGENKGRVIALGPFAHADWEGFETNTPEGKAKAWGYEVGDLVLFSRYDGTEYELPDCEGLVLMNASLILGKVEE